MNKFLCLLLVAFSFPIYAQNEPPQESRDVLQFPPVAEVNSEEVLPNEAPETLVDTEDKTEEKLPEASEAVTELKEETPDPSIALAPVATAPVNTSTTKADEDEDFNPRRSHWMASFGFEGMEYLVPFSYTGVNESFTEESRKLYGGRIGLGREIHLGAGFLIGAMLEGYYMGTLFEQAKAADPELDLDVASKKDEGQIYGGDAVASLSFLWDFKTKNLFMDEWAYLFLEPFIEVGVGRAWAYNKKDYFYDTGDAAGTSEVQESYDHSFSDELTTARLGGGIKLTSRTGFYLYLKATEYRFDITRRKQKGNYQQDDGTQTEISSVDKDATMGPVLLYSIGGGYKF